MEFIHNDDQKFLNDEQKILYFSSCCSRLDNNINIFSFSAKFLKKIDKLLKFENNYSYLIPHIYHAIKNMFIIIRIKNYKDINNINKFFFPFKKIELNFGDNKIEFSLLYSHIINKFLGIDIEIQIDGNDSIIIYKINWFYNNTNNIYDDGFPIFLCGNNIIYYDCEVNNNYDNLFINIPDNNYSVEIPEIYFNFKIITKKEIDCLKMNPDNKRKKYKISKEIIYKTEKKEIRIILDSKKLLENIYLICLDKKGYHIRAIENIIFKKNNIIMYNEKGFFYNIMMQETIFNKIIDKNLYFISFNDSNFQKDIDTSIIENNCELIINTTVDCDILINFSNFYEFFYYENLFISQI